ncbi:MAG: DoxX family protein [Planctomycetes bacterium]|nr:DoxX family protein [Planctomycetota bacterium]
MLPILHPPETGYRTSLGLLAVRLVIGSAFMLHGWSKIQHPMTWMGDAFPGVLQALAAFSEFGGGACWILGLLTPLASLGILSTMAVAMMFHLKRGDPFVLMSQELKPTFEPAFAYLSVALLLLFAGPGRFSADAALTKRS